MIGFCTAAASSIVHQTASNTHSLLTAARHACTCNTGYVATFTLSSGPLSSSKLIALSYKAHHNERVATIAAVDNRIQFEMDTTDADRRQVMLQKMSGANTAKVRHC